MQCTLCKDANDYNPGLIGSRSSDSKIMLILHRSDTRVYGFLQGYWGAFTNSATGSVLDRMLKRAGLDFEDVYITNFFKCLLPGNRRPTRREYEACKTILDAQIRDFKPTAMVVFGNEPYRYLFKQTSKEKSIGLAGELVYEGTPCLVSIHPSHIWKKLNPELQEPDIKKVSDFLMRF